MSRPAGDYHFTLVGDDLSLNSFGRLFILAEAARRLGEVEILGATTKRGGNEVWPVMDRAGLSVKCFDYPSSSRHAAAAYERMAKEVRGNILYAGKARTMSLGFALWYRRRFGTPVLVDYDDDEKAFVRYGGGRLRRSLLSLREEIRAHPGRRSQLCRMEKGITEADGISVCSRVFRERFGGAIIPHGRDKAHLDPAKYRGLDLKANHGFDNRPLILFLGTPQPHKGLQDLIEAFLRFDPASAQLLLVGVDPNDPPSYVDLNHPGIRAVQGCSWRDLPEFVALSDIVAIPQRKDPITEGQMPAKLTDAMGMGKAILASRVSDIPEYLDGRGYLFEPGDVDDLCAKLKEILAGPKEAADMGVRSREYFLKNLTYEAMSDGLAGLLESMNLR
jgi:glycosyltransferase involved in cell wall biosynthesis